MDAEYAVFLALWLSLNFANRQKWYTYQDTCHTVTYYSAITIKFKKQAVPILLHDN